MSVNINYYKNIIENRKFNQYDIQGFLIWVRPKLNDSDVLREFCDSIAHPKKNCGIIYNSLNNAINNKYETVKKRKKNGVKGFRGVSYEALLNSLKNILNKLDVKYDRVILKEIMVCLFSLIQDTVYQNGNNSIGKIALAIDHINNNLALTVTEGKSDSLFVCFSLIEGVEILVDKNIFVINDEVEALRIDGILYLLMGDKKILYVNDKI